MKYLISALCFVALCGCDATPAPETRVLKPDAFENVRVGMSVDAAETSLGSGLDPRAAADPQACVMAKRSDGKDPNILYMIEGGKIVRIDVKAAAAQGEKAVTTQFGIGIGTSEAELERAYGSKAVQEPHPYTYEEGGHLYIVEDGANAIIFETANGKVESFRAGAHPQVDYKEGCA